MITTLYKLNKEITEKCYDALTELNFIFGSTPDFWLYQSLKNQLEYVIQLMNNPKHTDHSKINKLLIDHYAIHEIDHNSSLQKSLIELSSLIRKYRIATEGETSDDLSSRIRAEIWKKQELQKKHYLHQRELKNYKTRRIN